MRDYDKDIKFDDLRDESYLRIPKLIATITLCGNMTIRITDNMPCTKPTPEQIKNLHDLLCIDVVLFDE